MRRGLPCSPFPLSPLPTPLAGYTSHDSRRQPIRRRIFLNPLGNRSVPPPVSTSSSLTDPPTASKEWVIPAKPKPGRKPKKEPVEIQESEEVRAPRVPYSKPTHSPLTGRQQGQARPESVRSGQRRMHWSIANMTHLAVRRNAHSGNASNPSSPSYRLVCSPTSKGKSSGMLLSRI